MIKFPSIAHYKSPYNDMRLDRRDSPASSSHSYRQWISMQDIEVELLPQGDEGSGFRTRNVENQKARRVLVDRGDRVVARASIRSIDHGTLTPGRKEEGEMGELATLMGFEFQFTSMKQSRRFRRATITLVFEDASGIPANQPEVHRISPEGYFALNKQTTPRTVNHRVNGGVSVGGGAVVGGNLGYEWQMESTKDKVHYTSLVGTKRVYDLATGLENAVIWSLEEDRETNGGIPSLFRAAVLLRRVDEVPFKFTIKVQTDVDWVTGLRALIGLQRSDPVDPVEVGPETDLRRLRIGGLDSTVDRTNLDALDLEEVDVILVSEIQHGP
jgi:hypothetical protein